MTNRFFITVGSFMLAALVRHATASDQSLPTPEQTAFFEQKIRPVLVESCYQCHSAAAVTNKKLKGGLYVDSREGLLKGGDTGPAIVPGQSAKSLLIKAMKWDDDNLQMPPKTRLPDSVISDFARWIDMGAPDPRTGGPIAKREIDIVAGREHWSYRPLQKVPIPQVKNTAWATTDIDRFILAGLESAGIAPSAPVSREKLARRAYFDLTGLPPTPEQMREFLADESPTAFGKLLDRLLASEQYGERWGRHWLDVVRYAESGGYEFDAFRPGAYHYRDWVIKAINNDMPYDQFVRMQLAGDKLMPGELEGAAAAGFLVSGPYPGQITAKTRERIRYDQLDDMIATTGEAMLATTLKCVRCHEHKYDPIPQKDYYGLASALARTEHGDVKIDPNHAETQQKVEAFEAATRPMREALAAYTRDELPGRLEAWRTQKLPTIKYEPATRWQALDVLSASAVSAQLHVAAGGIIRYESGKEKDDTYTIKAVTFQTGLSQIRLDALADKASPKNGPGLSDNGNFVLADLKVIAKPLDPADKTKPITLKLNAVKATFEQKDYPLSAAVDNSPQSGWAVSPKLGVDHAAVFGIEGQSVGFPGGTELEIQLKFSRFFGLGKARLSFGNAENPLALETPVEPQNLRELLAMLRTPAVTSNVTPNDRGPAAASKQATPAAQADPTKNHLLRWFGAVDEKASGLLAALQNQEMKRPRPPLINVYSTRAGGADVYLLKRGEVDNKAGKADVSFLQVLTTGEADQWINAANTIAAAPGNPAAPMQGRGRSAARAARATPPSTPPTGPDGRVALAYWITDTKAGAGQLLARVIVNRVWKYHFGEGLVRTPNDFGIQGDKPTHPELLDYLASELIRNNWQLKPLHRLIMTSAAYQQGADNAPAAMQRDPENKLWWHRPSRRLEAEAVRDSLLVVGGRLDSQLYGPSVAALESPRRSVYLRVKRSELVPFMTLFDGPEPTQSIGDRGTTTVPTQALTLMNSPFVRDTASRLAKRARADAKTTEEAVDHAFKIALGRSPNARERNLFESHIRTQIAELQPADKNPAATVAATERALLQACMIILCSNEFIYVD
ncbi:PSD1 and planctomycete cytochrome C domain-containing protein [Humisphaera borealis]|uniref:PSD1 domain-containing protein n=1 Tax=Humisphaera borealis TaxID=2807512 RepID=A0A7M2X0W7_9BACT|nr:PSD1 and planctomycete cytochrome C domain-containing protein [Humisphaera borealis]QOV90380.1 PSD1 domain-containing protein [Humisphaera borealis]